MLVPINGIHGHCCHTLPQTRLICSLGSDEEVHFLQTVVGVRTVRTLQLDRESLFSPEPQEEVLVMRWPFGDNK